MQLEFLTDDDETVRICVDYWRQAENGRFALTVREIAHLYGIRRDAISTLVETYSFVWQDDICCGRCKNPYRFSTRTQYQNRRWFQDRICLSCQEAEHREIVNRKKTIISEMRRSAEGNKPSLENLDLITKIYLLATTQTLGNENLTTIESLNDYSILKLSPDPDYDKTILRHLIQQNLLLISLDTHIEAVQLSEDGQFAIEIGESKFNLALHPDQVIALMNEIYNAETASEIIQVPEFAELCHEAQLNECLAFLKLALGKHRLYLSPGKKTRQVLTQCLEHFSVAQIYCLIWRAAKDAAAYSLRPGIGRRHAANSVVGNISRYMETALANGWDIKAFRRDYDLPQSSLSRILFNVVLGTDDGGFKYALHELLDGDRRMSTSL